MKNSTFQKRWNPNNCHLLPVFVEPPTSENSNENKDLRKYADLLRLSLKLHRSNSALDIIWLRNHFDIRGQQPYEMHEAADALVKLSKGIHEEPLLDVSWSGPHTWFYMSHLSKIWGHLWLSRLFQFNFFSQGNSSPWSYSWSGCCSSTTSSSTKPWSCAWLR